MRSVIFFLIFFTVIPGYAQDLPAFSCRTTLTPAQIERVRSSQALLPVSACRPHQETVKDFNRSKCPAIHVLMLEAMSRTYSELVREYDLEDPGAQLRLYSKVQLNMAYLQLTGPDAKDEGSALNRLIRRKLMQYLPRDILTHPAFYSPPE